MDGGGRSRPRSASASRTRLRGWTVEAEARAQFRWKVRHKAAASFSEAKTPALLHVSVVRSFERRRSQRPPPKRKPLLGVCPRHLPPRGAASRRASALKTHSLSLSFFLSPSISIYPAEVAGCRSDDRSLAATYADDPRRQRAARSVRRAAAGALECRPSLFMRGVPTRPADLGRRQFRPRPRIARTRCCARRRRRKKSRPDSAVCSP